MASGILFGELTQDSADITDSVLYSSDESSLKESLPDFLAMNEKKITETLPDTNEEVVSDSAVVIDYLRQKGYQNARFATSGEFFPFRSKIGDYLKNEMNLSDSTEVLPLLREKSLLFTQDLLQEKVEARDKYIAQARNSIDYINSILNLIYARLSEW